MKTVKSLFFVLIAPAIITGCFFTNQITGKEISRAPAIEKVIKVKSVKSAVKNYLLAINNI